MSSRGQLPRTLEEFSRVVDKFEGWLLERGSSILAPTNKYEVLRFSVENGVGIIYRNERDLISSWQNGADTAFLAFRTNASWVAAKREAKPGTARKRAIIGGLLARDGATCGLCGRTTTGDDRTIEHFAPRSSGGSNNLNNLMLVHAECNSRLGNLSVREKIELIVAERQERKP